MKFIQIRDEVIVPKLVDMLGKTMAESLSRESRFATAGAKDDNERLHITVEKTCSDERFIGMWGTAQADKQKEEWLELLS